MRYIIGIDEVGRGCLAGPVTVAAVLLPRNFNFREVRLFNIRKSDFLILRDSKRLSFKQRKIWFRYIKGNKKIFYSRASIPAKIIDKINISKAANLAATKAAQKLINRKAASRLLLKKQIKIFLDGGLKLGEETFFNSKAGIRKRKDYKIKTIIKGDEKIPVIMLASIVAKVGRDRQMVKFHKKYPKYGFDRHKGYGTSRHIKAVKKHGPSKIHRLTFLKKIG